MFRLTRTFSTLVVGLILGLTVPQKCSGQQVAPLAIHLAPESTSFYWSSINHDKMLVALLNSDAWRNLASSEGVQTIIAELRKHTNASDFSFPFSSEHSESAVVEFFANEGNAESVQRLLIEMIGNEIFVFGDKHWPKSIEICAALLSQTFSNVRESAGPDLVNELDDAQKIAVAKIFQKLMNNEFADLEFPGTVLGGRIRNLDLAKRLVRTLAPIVKKDLAALPEEFKFLAAGCSLVEQEDRTLLVVQAKASELPWKKLFSQDDETKIDEEILKSIEAGLGDRQIVVAIGHIGSHFVFVLAGSTEFVDQLGYESSLLDVAEVAPVKDYLDKDLVSISFVSHRMVNNSWSSVFFNQLQSELAEGIALGLNGMAPNPELQTDVEKLINRGVELMPERGAVLRFSFLTNDGFEGYQHEYGKTSYLDGSKPLDILEHLGGTPAIAFACRLKNRERVVSFFDEIHELTKKYSDDQRDENVQETVSQVNSIWSITKEKLIPSTADGQIAAILDLNGGQIPSADQDSQLDFRMPEIALLLGVNDRALFLESLADCRKLFADFGASKLTDQLKVTESDLNGSRLFSIDLGDDAELAGFAPSLFVGEKFAGLVIGKDHARRLIAASPFEFARGKLNSHIPACAIFHYDNVQVIDAFSGWATQAVNLYNAFSENPVDEGLLETAGHISKFLKAFKGYSSITIEENGRLVTRFVYRFENEK